MSERLTDLEDCGFYAIDRALIAYGAYSCGTLSGSTPAQRAAYARSCLTYLKARLLALKGCNKREREKVDTLTRAVEVALRELSNAVQERDEHDEPDRMVLTGDEWAIAHNRLQAALNAVSR